MPDYISVPIETDPDAITQIGFDYMEEQVPGWTPADGNLDVWILSAIGRQAAEVRDVASDVPLAILRYIGFYIFGLIPIDASSATALTNWTMQNNAGYTILDGTNVGIRDLNGDLIPFVTVGDFTVPALSTTASNIPIAALDPGIDGTALGSPGSNVELIDAIAGPISITLVTATAGGADEEDDSIYISRLITYLRMISPRPVKAQDFADLSQNISGIFRSAAIEGLNGTSGLSGQVQCVTVFPVDINGIYVGNTIADQYISYVQPMMSPNFSVFRKAVSPHTINEAFSISLYPGWDPVDRKAAAEAAVATYLNPATWGAPPFGDARQFIVTNTIKINDIIGVLYRVDGVQYVNSVTQSISPAGLTATDIIFPNPTTEVGVPTPGTITGTVV